VCALCVRVCTCAHAFCKSWCHAGRTTCACVYICMCVRVRECVIEYVQMQCCESWWHSGRTVCVCECVCDRQKVCVRISIENPDGMLIGLCVCVCVCACVCVCV